MNQIRQAEFLKVCHKAGMISSKDLHDALHYPVFIYTVDSKRVLPKESMDAITSDFMESDYRLKNPVFPCFRLIPHSDAHDYWMQVWVTKNTTRYLLVPESNTVNGVAIMIGHDGGPAGHYITGIKDGKVVGRDDLKVLLDDGQTFVDACIVNPTLTITMMELDLSTKASVQIKVEPKAEGKSVEWVQARTHYLLLHPKIAAQCCSSKRGPTIHEIKRSAGWRRAHFRVLRSARFTKKRGARVPVVQAWVGPREWTGLDGKIYKVCL